LRAVAVQETKAEREFDYDRTVALSDGVFAIALTLLVLSIDAPEPGPNVPPSGELLLSQWRDILSYAISVGVIGLLWLRHHTFFRQLTRIDIRLSELNLAYLGLVAFLPFPTELVGDNVEEPDAVIIYSLTVGLITGVAGIMRVYADRHGMLTAEAHREPLWRLVLVPAVFVTSIPIALVSPLAAQLWWIGLLLTRLARRSTEA
jgi:uncharacterized membrane protein